MERHDEFTYDKHQDLGRGRHRQVILYKGKEIGYLVAKEKNWLAPIEESYVLPDVDYGMQEGWIDFKVFKDYDEAFEYAKENFEQLVFLFENGDYD